MSVEDWHYPRPELAASILATLSGRATKGLYFAAAGGFGKTTFLMRDVADAARSADPAITPVYVDFGVDPDHPIAVMSAALRRAVPERKPWLRLLDKVDFEFAGVGLGLKMDKESDADQKGRDPGDASRLLGFIDVLAQRGGPVLFLLDNVDRLPASTESRAIHSVMAAATNPFRYGDQRPGSVMSVYTGTSEKRMRDLFGGVTSPLRNLAVQEKLPPLDDRFVAHIVHGVNKRYAPTLGISYELDERKAVAAFHVLGNRVRELTDMLSDMARDRSTDFTAYVNRKRAQIASNPGLADFWNGLTWAERICLQRIARGYSLVSSDAFGQYKKNLSRSGLQRAAVEGLYSRFLQEGVVIGGSVEKPGVLSNLELEDFIRVNASRRRPYPVDPTSEQFRSIDAPQRFTFFGGGHPPETYPRRDTSGLEALEPPTQRGADSRADVGPETDFPLCED